MRLVERFDYQRAEALFDVPPTLFFGVPTIYVRLLELPAWRPPAVSASTLASSCPARRRPAHVHEAFRGRFGHTILERYGMSETLMLISNPYEGERRAGTVGYPLPGVSVRLAKLDGSAPGQGDRPGARSRA